jgi:uncharacterized protein YjbJ (UPF0337 family)
MSISGRIKGAAQEVSGKVKEATGQAVGNPDLEKEGREEGATGEARQKIEKDIEQAKGAVQQATGRGKAAAGAAIGDTGREVEGKLEEVEGKIRQKGNE